MNTITVRVIGGLGNQLHCYAFGRALAARTGAPLALDASSGFWDDMYRRKFMLDRFAGLNAAVLPQGLHGSAGRFLFKLKHKSLSLLSKFFPLEFRSIVHEAIPRRYQPEIHNADYRFDSYFCGYWASYKYYAGIEEALRGELKPPMPTSPEALTMLSRIGARPSCAVHWRSYKEEKGVYHPDMRGYYLEAMEKIAVKHPGVVFYVFSDDPGNPIPLVAPPGCAIEHVDLAIDDETEKSLADFFLMSSCAHSVIGDSTFSWWAAWLSDRNGKTIVAPGGLSPWGQDWAPPHWITLAAVERNLYA